MKKRHLGILAALLVCLSACTKQRPVEFPDGVGNDYVPKSEFLSSHLSLDTQDLSQAQSAASVHGAIPIVVKSLHGSDRLSSMFKNMTIVGKPASSYPVRFSISDQYVTAYKVVQDRSELTPREVDLGKDEGGSTAVPLFQYDVKACGILVKIKNDLDQETNKLRFQATDCESATHLQVSTLPGDRHMILDSNPKVRVSDLKGEFFFRRTLQDSPNTFDISFAGESGPLKIVKFVFERDQVRIVDADPKVKTPGGTDADLNAIMILPAKYYRTSSPGDLTLSSLQETNSTDPEAYIDIDWAKNALPNLVSPIDYYELETCFDKENSVRVYDIDRRLNDGMLSFTLEHVYQNARDGGCTGLDGLDDTSETNFDFRERISFKRYDRPAVEKPLLSVPFDAQKKLGFGLFTGTRIQPDSYANTDQDGAEVSVAQIFDLNANPHIDYYLAGLPSDLDERKDLIKATQDVVDDWNRTFKMTTGRDSVLRLQVEGDDGVVPKQLGDLDRNYIYYIQKKTESPVIGLGGAHGNPRTGAVVAASVFIYGGNINGYIESLRQREKATAEYAKNIGLPAVISAATPSPLSTSVPVSNQSSNLSDGQAQAPSAAVVSATLAAKSQGSVPPSESALSRLESKLTPMESVFMDSLQRVQQENAFQDSRRVREIVLESQMKLLSPTLGEKQRSSLKAAATREKILSKLVDHLEQQNFCVYDTAESDYRGELGREASMSDRQVEIAIYKATLLHELGHNLGLRHNFMGSYDKDNWKFSPSESTPRAYSSIMDYMVDDHLTYDGAGPQDAMAIRAAYAGQLEMADGKMMAITDVLSKAGLSSWTDLTRARVAALNLHSYQFCTDEDAGTFPTCNMFDRGTTPKEIVDNAIFDYQSKYSLRNFANSKLHFDWYDQAGYIGGLIQTFQPIRQFLDETAYLLVSGEFGQLSDDMKKSYIDATFTGDMFFQSVIETPDLKVTHKSEGRFSTYQYETQDPKDSKKTVAAAVQVEKKYLKDVLPDSTSDRLYARGIEFDKALAFIFLSLRDPGGIRYARSLIKISYPDFEKLAFGGKVADEDLPTISLLQQTLTNRIVPSVMDPSSHMRVQMQSGYSVEPSDTLRFQALLSSMVRLDVDGIEAKDNFSRLFRTLSGYDVPQGVLSTRMEGDTHQDPNALKYWAAAGGVVADKLVRTAEAISLMRNAKELPQKFSDWIMMKMLVDRESQKETAAALAVDLKKFESELDSTLSKLPPEISELPRKMDTLGPILYNIVNTTLALGTKIGVASVDLEAAKKSGDQIKLAKAQKVIDDLSTQVDLVKDNLVQYNRLLPIMGAMIQSMKIFAKPSVVPMFTPEVSKAMNDILDRWDLTNESKLNEGMLFSNISLLSEVFLDQHPNYRR